MSLKCRLTSKIKVIMDNVCLNLLCLCGAYYLKRRVSVIRNNFLEYRTKQATLFTQRNDLYALFATNKAKNILNRHFSCSCSDINYSKIIKKN